MDDADIGTEASPHFDRNNVQHAQLEVAEQCLVEALEDARWPKPLTVAPVSVFVPWPERP